MAVRDFGIGIPADEVEKLGARYFRASTATGFTGTGIGLSLVREIIEMHDSALDVTSEVGEGTSFTVTLPRWESAIPGLPLARCAAPGSGGQVAILPGCVASFRVP